MTSPIKRRNSFLRVGVCLKARLVKTLEETAACLSLGDSKSIDHIPIFLDVGKTVFIPYPLSNTDYALLVEQLETLKSRITQQCSQSDIKRVVDSTLTIKAAAEKYLSNNPNSRRMPDIVKHLVATDFPKGTYNSIQAIINFNKRPRGRFYKQGQDWFVDGGPLTVSDNNKGV